MTTVLIRGARLIQAGAVSPPVDVLVRDGQIKRVGEGPVPPGARLVEGAGAYLSPGWIDLHVHAYPGVSELGLDPDAIGLRTGVHLLLDAGSAGATTVGGLRDYVAAKARTQVLALLHISSMGLIVVKGATELPDMRWINMEQTARAIRENAGFVRGVKIRASGGFIGHLGGQGMEAILLARKAARDAGLPLMVHIGGGPPALPDILDAMEAGDMITHCFHGKRDSLVLDGEGRILPAVQRARDRGVWFDIGHGAASYTAEIARAAIAQGFVPDVISTDLHIRNVNGPVYDLATTMTKLLAAGMDLPAVVRAVTERPAEWLGEPGFRRIAPGEAARLTLFRLEETEREVTDATRVTERVNRWIRPLAAITPEGVVACES